MDWLGIGWIPWLGNPIWFIFSGLPDFVHQFLDKNRWEFAEFLSHIGPNLGLSWGCKLMRFFGSQRLENPLKVVYPCFILFEFSGISFFYPFFILLHFGVFLFILFLIIFLSCFYPPWFWCVFVYHCFIHFLSFFNPFFILLAAKWIKIGFSRYKRQRAEEKCRVLSFFVLFLNIFLSLLYPFFILFLSLFYPPSCKMDQNWLPQIQKAKGWGKV